MGPQVQYVLSVHDYLSIYLSIYLHIQVLQHFSLVSNSSLVVGFLQKFIAKKQQGVGVEATGSHVTPQTSHVTKIEKKEVKPEVIVI